MYNNIYNVRQHELNNDQVKKDCWHTAEQLLRANDEWLNQAQVSYAKVSVLYSILKKRYYINLAIKQDQVNGFQKFHGNLVSSAYNFRTNLLEKFSDRQLSAEYSTLYETLLQNRKFPEKPSDWYTDAWRASKLGPDLAKPGVRSHKQSRPPLEPSTWAVWEPVEGLLSVRRHGFSCTIHVPDQTLNETDAENWQFTKDNKYQWYADEYRRSDWQ